jgi:hypothetical protein
MADLIATLAHAQKSKQPGIIDSGLMMVAAT